MRIDDIQNRYQIAIVFFHNSLSAARMCEESTSMFAHFSSLFIVCPYVICGAPLGRLERTQEDSISLSNRLNLDPLQQVSIGNSVDPCMFPCHMAHGSHTPRVKTAKPLRAQKALPALSILVPTSIVSVQSLEITLPRYRN